MSENIYMAVIGGLAGLLQALCCGALWHIIGKLDRITDRLADHITKDSCNDKMCAHAHDIDELRRYVKENSEAIASLKAQHGSRGR